MSDALYTQNEYARRHSNWHREHSAWKANQVLAMLRRQPLALRTVSEVAHSQWAHSSVGHLHYFTTETALSALANVGYRVIVYFLTAVELDLPCDPSQHQRLRSLSQAWTSRILGGYSLLALCEFSENAGQINVAHSSHAP